MAPVREVLAHEDDNCENWRLNDLTGNLKKNIWTESLITSTGDKPSSSEHSSKDYSRGGFMKEDKLLMSSSNHYQHKKLNHQNSSKPDYGMHPYCKMHNHYGMHAYCKMHNQ